MRTKVLLLIPFCLDEVLYPEWSVAPGGECGGRAVLHQPPAFVGSHL